MAAVVILIVWREGYKTHIGEETSENREATVASAIVGY
jgi:hypothetical protein